MRLRGPVDLLAIIAASVLLVPFIILDIGAMRIVFGLPFILFFPGYALIALLFPRKKDIDWIERIALSFGLSIALVPLTGLLLNYVWEIRLYPILVSLEILTLGLSVGAWVRRVRLVGKDSGEDATADTEGVKKKVKRSAAAQAQKTTRGDAFLEWNVRISFPEWKSYGRLDKALTVILALAIVASVSVLVYVIAVPKTGERFTEFYILGPGGKADGYPVKMNWNQNGTVIIGVANHEYANVTYRLDVLLHNESIYTQIFTLPSIPVDIDKPWEPQWETEPGEFNFTISHPSDYRMDFLLFKGNATFLDSLNPLEYLSYNYAYSKNPENRTNLTTKIPYRSLHLWVRDFAIFDENGCAIPANHSSLTTNHSVNLTAVCDFAREIFADKYGTNATINYAIVAMQGGAEVLRAPFTVTKINKTSANITFNGETRRMPASLRIPLTLTAGGAGDVEFLVFRNDDYSHPFRSAVWNE